MNANEVITNIALELAGTREGRLRLPAPDRRHEPQPVDERRLPDRDQGRRSAFVAAHAARRARPAAQRVPRQGRRVPRHPEGRPHAAAGCRADDARAGVPRLRHDARRGPRPPHARTPSCCPRSTWAPRRSAPASPPTPATRSRGRATSARSPGSTSRPRPTSSSRRATPARSCRSRRRSSATRSSSRRSATTCGCSPRGPQAGFGEINLPPRQAGSSIMPGKVNPVIPEVVNQVAFAVAGADMTVTMAAEARPAAAQRLRAGHRALAASSRSRGCARRCWTLRVNCVDGITANAERLGAMVGVVASASSRRSPRSSATPRRRRSPRRRSLTGRNVADLVVEAGLMTRDEVDAAALAGAALGPATRSRRRSR